MVCCLIIFWKLHFGYDYKINFSTTVLIDLYLFTVHNLIMYKKRNIFLYLE